MVQWWVLEVSVTFGREIVGKTMWWTMGRVDDMVGMNLSIKLPKAFRHYWDTGHVHTPYQDCCLFFADIGYHLSLVEEVVSLPLISRWHELHNHHARSLEVLWMLRKGGHCWKTHSHDFMLAHISNHSKMISRFPSSCRCFRRLFCWKRSSELRFPLRKALVALECRWGVALCCERRSLFPCWFLLWP